MSLQNRFTARFGIQHPIALAPMDLVSDWRLARAVADAGGFGIIGGSYCEEPWLAEQFACGPVDELGIGLITWALTAAPDVLPMIIAHRPAAIVLSFGDPAAHAPAIHAAGIPLICQVQTLDHARRALDVGATAIVAQGGEAGGHGIVGRSTFTLVPETADLIGRHAPDTLLLAAGGIADGRGLAAALALGADGALVGTRFWTSTEAAISESAQQRGLSLSGDDTVRQHVFDIIRGKPWPSQYTGRVARNAFIDRWHGDEAGLHEQLNAERVRFQAGVDAVDYDVGTVIVGESIGQVERVEPVAAIVGRMVDDAARILGREPALN